MWKNEQMTREVDVPLRQGGVEFAVAVRLEVSALIAALEPAAAFAVHHCFCHHPSWVMGYLYSTEAEKDRYLHCPSHPSLFFHQIPCSSQPANPVSHSLQLVDYDHFSQVG